MVGPRWATGGRAVFEQSNRTLVLTETPVLHDGSNEVAAPRAPGLFDPVQPDHERAGAAYLSNGSGVATAARHAAATKGASRPASARASPEARCWRSAASWARA